VIGNREFNNRKKDFRNAILSGEKYKINLILIVAGDFSGDQQKEIDVQKQKDSIKIGNNQFDLTFETWDKEFIYNRIFHPKTNDVALEYEKVMEYTHGERENGFFIIKGTELNDHLKEEMYQPIFEYNPRFYLGLKSGGKKNINRYIKETAEDEEDSKNFLEYNNGITCLCDSFEIGEKTIVIKNLKIVNGCQTVVSLSKSAVNDNVKVLFKLYTIDQSSELKENISNYTNSQNPISPRDINSGHNQQRKIQREIASYDGFFWERKMGERIFHEYDKDWKRKHSPYSLRVIDNLKVAKLVYAYHYQNPYKAVMVKEADIFDANDESFKKIFNDTPSKQFILSWILELGRKKAVSAIKKDLGKNKDEQEWDIKHESILKLSSNNYFKHTSLAIFTHYLNENPINDNIEQAIIKIMSASSRKDTKRLTISKQFEFIIPIFIYLLGKLETGMRGKFFDDQDISKLESKEIIAKLENKTSINDIKSKLETMNDETDKGITNKLKDYFDRIIEQSEDLD